MLKHVFPGRLNVYLQPVATLIPAIGAGLLIAVGAKAVWDAASRHPPSGVRSDGNP